MGLLNLQPEEVAHILLLTHKLDLLDFLMILSAGHVGEYDGYQHLVGEVVYLICLVEHHDEVLPFPEYLL